MEMCPMCERTIGEDTPRVCPHCGWELLQLEESPTWVTTVGAGVIPRLVEPAAQKL